jgi:hypothetical protein
MIGRTAGDLRRVLTDGGDEADRPESWSAADDSGGPLGYAQVGQSSAPPVTERTEGVQFGEAKLLMGSVRSGGAPSR